MAVTVPAYEQGVQSRGIGAPQVSRVNEGNVLGDIADPLAQQANAIYQKTQEEADTAALWEAEASLDNWKTDTLFNPESGVYSKKGRSALDITNQTMPQFQQQADALGNTLTNDRQRRRWSQIVAAKGTQFNAELNRYEFGERSVYLDQAANAQLESAQNNALQYSNDPEMVARYQNKGAAIIASEGRRKGWAEEEIANKVAGFNSTMALGVVNRLAVSDPLKAQEFYAKNAAYMTAGDQLNASKMLGTSVRQQFGSQIGTALWNDGTPGTGALPALIMQAESGGDPTTVSSKGARGLMQLMPDTAKEMAGELGIPYDEERLTTDPNYNAALGTAYINKMLGKYGGSSVLAVAAYNAGPGAVDKWIKENGDPRTGEISQSDWIEKIPYKETRDYTGKIVGQLVPGQTGASKYSAAVNKANQIPDPQLRKFTLDRIDDLHKAQQIEQKASYEEAAKYLDQGGYSAIPSSLLSSLEADDQLKLRRMDDYRRKGQEPTTDYDKLQEFLSMPIEQLADLSLARDVRPYLNNADFNRVSTAYQRAVQGDGSTQGGIRSEERALQQVMSMAGIQTGDSKAAKQPENLEKQQQFRAAYQARKDAIFEATGKQPTAKEAGQIAQELLMEVRLRGAGVFGTDSRTRQLWEVAPEDLSKSYVDRGDVEVKDIPPQERLRITQALRANGQPLTQANIIGAYLQRLSGLGVSVQ